jgi:uncharacterized membrane protein
MQTTPIIESLSHSLDHWQFLYILAIVVALLSTFAIVIFAFHIEQHRAGLKISNYVYVVASVLAVVSTIVIVVKTKSLDAEKDRVANVEIGKAKAAASEADAKAEGARLKAEQVTASAEEARKNSLLAEAEAQKAVLDKTKILHDNLVLQQQIEQERTARQQIEQNLAPRNLAKVGQTRITEQLLLLSPQEIDCVIYAGNPEAQNLANQIAYAFQAANWKFHYYSPMGGSLQGVLVEYDGNDQEAIKVANIVMTELHDSGIQAALSYNLPPLMQQIGAYASDNGATGTAKVRLFVGSK